MKNVTGLFFLLAPVLAGLVAGSGTALLVLPSAAFAQHSAVCGWEDGSSTILGSFGNLGLAENVGSPDPVHSGDRALRLLEEPEGGTPQAFLGFVENLEDGDRIEACFWAFDTSPGSPPSLRIWAHYADGGKIDSHAGSASGNTMYTAGPGWSQVCHEWVFDSAGGARDALVVEARLYSPDGMAAEFYVDDVEVRVSSPTARITLACDDEGSAPRESTWGTIKSLYR